MSDSTRPDPTRPDPGETQYGGRRSPHPPDSRFPDSGRYENEHTWWGRRRRRKLNAELERRNLAADIADLEAELGIGRPSCHHTIWESPHCLTYGGWLKEHG